ncbi:MAG: endonuclease Q family protein [Candidatus Odinarchaeum yellowstonii]|uniref:Endonuclease Q family protein n=1 Tax=Odinarchaeota yellowstonii (strain LCB_4) TaxID=1841599 RepID=A0AAF0D1P9_ODILC|nr:MAG: endonuclease Q family protein [Candidatus Odinarchaeum yellowstonii]
MVDLIADLHIHGKYSGGSSKNLDIEELTYYAGLKGVSILATGDFTYSKWLSELESKLTFEEDAGIYSFRKDNFKVYFILQAEVNTVTGDEKRGGKRVHHIILAPSFDVVKQIKDVLARYGGLESDARPTLKIPIPEFIEVVKEVDELIEIIPAHIFTPWYGLLGSFNGYDHIRDCYEDKLSEIHCLETGLSADPTYIQAISWLDDYSIISCSDLHSYYPHRLGREATVFNLKKPSYKEIIEAIRLNDERLKMTIEFKPEEGKYNYDGCRPEHHTNGEDFYSHPFITDKLKNCPICKRKITRGVLSRVIQLSDRPLGFKREKGKPFKYLLPLTEIIAYTYNINSPWSSKVIEIYRKLVEAYGSEYNLLLSDNLDLSSLTRYVDEKLALNISAVKRGEFYFDPPGHDGVYGKLKIGVKEQKVEYKKEDKNIGQRLLTDY